VSIPLASLLSGQSVDQWLPVRPCAGCKKAKGELRVVVSFVTRKALHKTELRLRIKVLCESIRNMVKILTIFRSSIYDQKTVAS
jgi:hypothetical protein